MGAEWFFLGFVVGQSGNAAPTNPSGIMCNENVTNAGCQALLKVLKFNMHNLIIIFVGIVVLMVMIFYVVKKFPSRGRVLWLKRLRGRGLM